MAASVNKVRKGFGVGRFRPLVGKDNPIIQWPLSSIKQFMMDMPAIFLNGLS